MELFGQLIPPPPRPQLKFRKVFFSFHYDEDVWRVSQVRKSGMIPGYEQSGFIDAVAWQSLHRTGEAAVRRWIDQQMDGTSVTVVLIGSGTAGREYVHYEIWRSVQKGNGLVGVYIDQCENQYQQTCPRGLSPFLLHPPRNMQRGNGFLVGYAANPATYGTLDDQVVKYCWKHDRGFVNFREWIELAARQVGR